MSVEAQAKRQDLHIIHKAPHYNDHPKGYEAIDVIEDAPNGLLFNALKYLWRVCWGSKGGPEEKIADLEKTIYYASRERDNRKAALEKQRSQMSARSSMVVPQDSCEK